jgi:hypothetical protein
MARCDVCHNEYDRTFEVVLDGSRLLFDSFECAIHRLAPVCSHCGCRILGHGMEAAGKMFCCAHCASASGLPDMRDRA